jgi:hypothetical protein
MSKPQNEKPKDFSEEFTKISSHAREEILWVRSVYKLVFSGVIALIAVGIYFTYQNTHDLKADMQKDADTMRTSLHADFETLKQQQQQDLNSYSAQMHGEVTKRIDAEFATNEISDLVRDKAKERIDAIADALIQTNIQNKIDPIRKDFLQKLSQSSDEIQKRIEKLDADSQQTRQTEKELQQTMTDARDLLSKLNEQSVFMITALKAENDDRKAFETIKAWSIDGNYTFRNEAKAVSHSVEASYASSIASKTYQLVSWTSGVNPDGLTMSQFQSTWNAISPDVDVDLLGHLWSNTNIDKEEKLSFIHSVLITDIRLPHFSNGDGPI